MISLSSARARQRQADAGGERSVAHRDRCASLISASSACRRAACSGHAPPRTLLGQLVVAALRRPNKAKIKRAASAEGAVGIHHGRGRRSRDLDPSSARVWQVAQGFQFDELFMTSSNSALQLLAAAASGYQRHSLREDLHQFLGCAANASAAGAAKYRQQVQRFLDRGFSASPCRGGHGSWRNSSGSTSDKVVGRQGRGRRSTSRAVTGVNR